MATKAPARAIVSSFEVEPQLYERMKHNMKADESLRHVTRKRSPWLRKAVEFFCSFQEEERATNCGPKALIEALVNKGGVNKPPKTPPPPPPRGQGGRAKAGK